VKQKGPKYWKNKELYEKTNFKLKKWKIEN
jgi:hypothetical protein